MGALLQCSTVHFKQDVSTGSHSKGDCHVKRSGKYRHRVRALCRLSGGAEVKDLRFIL
jgi:hypothetical protein